MSDEIATPETPQPAPKPGKAILPKGYVLTIGGKQFRMAMNAVIVGDRADMIAAGLTDEMIA